jgi:WD40-like Beta Propeller Repeat
MWVRDAKKTHVGQSSRAWALSVVLVSLLATVLACCAPALALPGEPTLGREAVSNVGAGAAVLRAGVSLGGSPTSYYFQYSTGSTASCTSNTCVSVPAPPGKPIKSSGEVELEVQGLQASTQYHYRVVVVAEVEVSPGHSETREFAGADSTFITQGTTPFALPDGRAWEMVSPAEKLGARLASQSETGLSGGNVIEASADGEAITYISYAPTEASIAGYVGDVQVFSARGSAGWHSWDMGVPDELATGGGAGFGNAFRFFSEDLSVGFVQPPGVYIAPTPREEAEPLSPNDRALAPGAATEQTAFVHADLLNGDANQRCERPLASCFTPLVTSAPGGDVPTGTEFGGAIEGGSECPPAPFCGPLVEGATADGAYAALEMRPHPGQAGLYEWHAGTLAFVAASAELGSHNSSHTRNAISSNGSRVFYTSATGDLFMDDLSRNVTVQLDLPQAGCGSCDAGGRGVFQAASVDGSRLLFTDEQKLTADSGASTVDHQSDLYECHIVEENGGPPKCVLSDLTPTGPGGEAAAVRGPMVGISEDGSWVYFAANGVQENGGAPIGGAVKGTCLEFGAVSSQLCNLYVRHNGETNLVAVLSGADEPDWGNTGTIDGLEGLVSRVSPDGHWLAFMSERELTGYDNRDAVSGERDEEAYLFNAVTHRVVCASCDPTGALPRGERFDVEGTTGEPSMPLVTANVAGWSPGSWLAASLPEWTPYRNARTAYQSRFLTNNGRLLFDSDDALVPKDGNENWDVYEYEPPAVGGCATSSADYHEVAGGCISAISPGNFAGESSFMDASATGGREAEGNEGGGDVFFLTAASLGGQDKDDALDIYDAHECTTASPCITTAVAEATECGTTDSCRAAPSPEPGIFASPPTATSNDSRRRSSTARR